MSEKVMGVEAVIAEYADEIITGEQLFALGDIGRTELVNGRIIQLMPTGRPHSRIY